MNPNLQLAVSPAFEPPQTAEGLLADPVAFFQNLGVIADEETVIFIDGQHLYTAMRKLNLRVDFAKLRRFFMDHTRLTNTYYYMKVLKTNPSEPNNVIALLDWLQYNGYEVFTKDEFEQNSKVNNDIEIAVDMTQILARVPKPRNVFLFSGNTNFAYPFVKLREAGIRVFSVSVQDDEGTRSSITSSHLRRNSTAFISLHNLLQTAGAIKLEQSND